MDKLRLEPSYNNELKIRASKFFYPFISILGDPDYYTKFGYQTASKFNTRAPLVVDGLKDVSGTIEYPKAFE